MDLQSTIPYGTHLVFSVSCLRQSYSVFSVSRVFTSPLVTHSKGGRCLSSGFPNCLEPRHFSANSYTANTFSRRLYTESLHATEQGCPFTTELCPATLPFHNFPARAAQEHRSSLFRYVDHAENTLLLSRRTTITWKRPLFTRLLPSNDCRITACLAVVAWHRVYMSQNDGNRYEALTLGLPPKTHGSLLM
jgi:hypothetical protein